MTTPPDYDVAVVGGGPAGATAALVLARLGYDIALVEGSRYEQPRVGETLPPSARPLLEQLGLWEAFVALEALPSFGTASAWGGAELASQAFIFSPYGNGWHLDRPRFDALLASAAADAGARRLEGAHVSGCTATADRVWRLQVRTSDDGDVETTARAVIDASGRGATIARRLGAKRRVFDQLVGVATRYPTAPDAGGYTLVEATEHGWWYSAPVPPDQLIVMFMTDSDLCRAQRLAGSDVWERRLAQTQHTRSRVAGDSPTWGPKVHSALSHRLERTGDSGCWLACGDAALGADPLSSSGISRALRTGQDAAQAIMHWLHDDLEPAYRYERALDAEFATYWHERAANYAMETRWPDAPFWQRRVGSAAVLAPAY